MASQLLPLGEQPSPGQPDVSTSPNTVAELIDKCVGSRIWVVMKGDKGTTAWATWREAGQSRIHTLTTKQSLAAYCLDSTTTSVRISANADIATMPEADGGTRY